MNWEGQCDWSRGGSVENTEGWRSSKAPGKGQVENSGLYPKSHRNILNGFKERNDMTRFMFIKDHSGCRRIINCVGE